MAERPMVGVGVIVLRGGKVLLGKRTSKNGKGTWSFPGGHLEFGETPEECAKREAIEEAGIVIKNIRSVAFTNDFFEKEGKHYITIFLVSELQKGVPTATEPENFEKWEWFSWQELPEPLFTPTRSLIKQGYSPFK